MLVYHLMPNIQDGGRKPEVLRILPLGVIPNPKQAYRHSA